MYSVPLMYPLNTLTQARMVPPSTAILSLILRYGSFRVGLEEPKRDGPPPASSSLPAGCAPNRTRSALRRQHIQPRPLRRGSCRGAIHCRSPTRAPPSSSTPAVLKRVRCTAHAHAFSKSSRVTRTVIRYPAGSKYRYSCMSCTETNARGDG